MPLIRPATPGTLIVLAATVLLVLVSVSTPLLKSIYFLSANIAATQVAISADVRLGVWGFCAGDLCEGPRFGYEFDANSLLGVPENIINLPNSLIRGLTYCLIVHPIAAAFAAAATLCGLLGHIREMSIVLTVVSTWLAGIACTLAGIAFVFDMVLFTIARQRINAASTGQVAANASYGIAIWLTLAAFVLLIMAGCCFGCGRRIVGARDQQRQANSEYKPQLDNSYTSDARQNALMADKMRQDDHQRYGSASNAGLMGKSGRRGEQGLPAFAETGESVPLRSYTQHDDDEDVEAQTISGVGAGYGRRADNASMRTTTTGGAAGLGVATGAAAAVAGSGRDARQAPSNVESFQSMYPDEVSPSRSQAPPLPASSSYHPMPQPAGFGAYPSYDPSHPSPASSYSPSTIPAMDNARQSAIPFVPASSGAAALPGSALASEPYGSRPYYQSQATPGSQYTATPAQHYAQSSTYPHQQSYNEPPQPAGPPTYYTSNSEDPYAHIGAVANDASRRRASADYDLGSYYDGSPAVQHPARAPQGGYGGGSRW